MIRDGIKLKNNVLERLPDLTRVVKQHSDIAALYSFGSVAKKELKPLSDLDFAVLLSGQLSRTQRFNMHLGLIGIFNNIFRPDEIDLTVLNDVPIRFCFMVFKTGKFLYLKNKAELIEFPEQVIKNYMDFKYFRDSFGHAFLKGIGYNG